VSANPSENSRLQKLLRTGSAELEAALAESTDLDEKLSAALTAGVPEVREPSRLTRVLQTGEVDLQETLAASTDVEQRLTETLDEVAAEATAATFLKLGQRGDAYQRGHASRGSGDAVIDPEVLARAAGTAVVALMVTDAWGSTYHRVVALWRHVDPEGATAVGMALEETREELFKAQRRGGPAAMEDLEGDWCRRLRRLLVADPSAAPELEEILAAARASLPEDERPPALSEQMHAHAGGSARVYQVGGDQHIVER
jgi:hypothetical protein